MTIKPFAIERYFAKYEFNAEHLLSASDCEGLYTKDLLQNATNATLTLWGNLKLNYTDSQGHPLLRERIADLYPGLAPNNALVAAPEELIYLAMRTQLKAGDHVVVLTPCYQSLFSIAEEIGCEVSKWFIREVNGEWNLNIDELDGLIKANTRMLVVNFPNNPTGYLPTLAEFKQILAIAEKRGLLVFCDEMYRLLEPTRVIRLPSASTLYGRAIALSGLSKSFALPGLRLGWVTCQDQNILASMLQYKDYTTICISAPSEILAIMALEQKERIIARNIALIDKNTNLSIAAFSQFPQTLRWVAPTAGSIAFPAWLGKQEIDKLAEQLVTEHGLMLVPGEYFLVTNDHFRVGLGREDYAQSLDVFSQALKASGYK